MTTDNSLNESLRATIDLRFKLMLEDLERTIKSNTNATEEDHYFDEAMMYLARKLGNYLPEVDIEDVVAGLADTDDEIYQAFQA